LHKEQEGRKLKL